jgi:hypothetical protein
MPSGKGPARARSIRIEPRIRKDATARASRLGLSFSAYTCFLLRAAVDGHEPLKKPARKIQAILVRDPVSITIKTSQWTKAKAAAMASTMSFSEYVEALYLRDLQNAEPFLRIWQDL